LHDQREFFRQSGKQRSDVAQCGIGDILYRASFVSRKSATVRDELHIHNTRLTRGRRDDQRCTARPPNQFISQDYHLAHAPRHGIDDFSNDPRSLTQEFISNRSISKRDRRCPLIPKASAATLSSFDKHA
jgi:hypothetical protein